MKKNEIPQEIIDEIGEVVHIRYPRQGHTSIVAILSTKHGDFIIKLTNHPLYNKWLYKEYLNLQHLAQTSIPIPKVFKYVVDSDKRWLLMEYVEAISLREFLSNDNNKKYREEAIGSFGEILRNIHSTLCPKELVKEESWLDVILTEARHNLFHYKVDGTEELLNNI